MMDPFSDLILPDFNTDYMTDLEKETLYDEMIEGDLECLED